MLCEKTVPDLLVNDSMDNSATESESEEDAGAHSFKPEVSGKT